MKIIIDLDIEFSIDTVREVLEEINIDKNFIKKLEVSNEDYEE